MQRITSNLTVPAPSSTGDWVRAPGPRVAGEECFAERDSTAAQMARRRRGMCGVEGALPETDSSAAERARRRRWIARRRTALGSSVGPPDRLPFLRNTSLRQTHLPA